MAAPSRSINYRTGSAIEIDRASYFRVLYSLKGLDKEANQRMRAEAREIADTIVKPAVVSSILRYAAGFGPKLAQSVRATRDRLPKVVVGKSRGPYYSGPQASERGAMYASKATVKRGARAGQQVNQASTNMLRYGTIMGPYRTQSGSIGRFSRSGGVQNWAKSVTPKWTDRAAELYNRPTFMAWESAVDKLVLDYNLGRTPDRG